MDQQEAKAIMGLLAEISAGVRDDITGAIRDLVEIGKNSQATSKEIRAEFYEFKKEERERIDRLNLAATTVGEVYARLEANEQAVQSCLSTLGELNKLVHALAARSTGLPGIPTE